MHTIKKLLLISGLVLTVISASSSSAADSFSNLATDEVIQFFRTSAWLNDDGSAWMVPIHGWVYEPTNSHLRKASAAKIIQQTYGLKVTPENEANFSKRINLLLADNERDKKIVIEMAGKSYQLPVSQANGHFQTIVQVPLTVLQLNQAVVNYRATLKLDDPRHFSGQSLLISPIGTSIISDIDDTVKLTYVTERQKLVETTFFNDFMAVNGMGKLYQKWNTQGAQFHFVSSSPWQLYSPLDEFLIDNNFPLASLSLKDIRFRDTTILNLFKKGTETKPAAIELILSRYPKRHFVLVGDSGEQDAQVYASIAEKYPHQIDRVLIRNVGAKEEPSLDINYQKIFSNIDRQKWQIFNSPDEIN